MQILATRQKARVACGCPRSYHKGDARNSGAVCMVSGIVLHHARALRGKFELGLVNAFGSERQRFHDQGTSLVHSVATTLTICI